MKKTIFYSWARIAEYCKGDIHCIVKTFKTFTNKPVPPNLSGKSFILNLKDLLDSKALESEIVEYLLLASLRNYFDYKYQNDTTLYLFFSDISSDRIRKNKLLTLENNYIKFIYEENHGN
jgi:hypothetical protein